MAIWVGLTNSCEKRRSESKGEKEKYKYLNFKDLNDFEINLFALEKKFRKEHFNVSKKKKINLFDC